MAALKIDIDTARMDDAVEMLHCIATVDPDSVEHFLSMNEELCDVEFIGAGVVVIPSEALRTFIDWNRNKLQ